MKIIEITPSDLYKMITRKPVKKMIFLVVDNSARFYQPIKFPIVGDNFIWLLGEIRNDYISCMKNVPYKCMYSCGGYFYHWSEQDKEQVVSIPLTRAGVFRILEEYYCRKIKDNGEKIIIFHHHDLDEPYKEKEEEGIELYEFSHGAGLLYQALEEKDSKLISHMIGKDYFDFEKVIIKKGMKKGTEIKHWVFNKLILNKWQVPSELDLSKFEREDVLIFSLAFYFGPKNIIPDARRYRGKHHDDLMGLSVDQYAIPSFFRNTEINTGTELDYILSKLREKTY